MDTIESLKLERDAARAEVAAERVARCFDQSAFIREKLTVPPDLVAATFRKHFSIEDGRAVAKDAKGQQIMSRERPGEPADFDDALQTLVAQCDYADQITRRPGGDGKRNATLPPLSRKAWEALRPGDQAAWVMHGGRVSD